MDKNLSRFLIRALIVLALWSVTDTALQTETKPLYLQLYSFVIQTK